MANPWEPIAWFMIFTKTWLLMIKMIKNWLMIKNCPGQWSRIGRTLGFCDFSTRNTQRFFTKECLVQSEENRDQTLNNFFHHGLVGDDAATAGWGDDCWMTCQLWVKNSRLDQLILVVWSLFFTGGLVMFDPYSSQIQVSFNDSVTESSPDLCYDRFLAR